MTLNPHILTDYSIRNLYLKLCIHRQVFLHDDIYIYLLQRQNFNSGFMEHTSEGFDQSTGHPTLVTTSRPV